MTDNFKLYMIMLGCTPKGRFTEQHDIFFGIGKSLKDLVPQMKAFWPEAKGKIHIDAWREITSVSDYSIKVVKKENFVSKQENLFFINLGGYKENEFEEYHYKSVVVASSLSLAIKQAKKSTFFKHNSFKGAISHIDDKYGIDVDNCYNLNDVLAETYKENFALEIIPSSIPLMEDKLHIGYLKIAKIV